MGITDIGTPTIVNRAFIPLAIEAGIVPVIRSLIGFGKSKRSLLIDIFEALQVSNPELALALNLDTLDLLLEYMVTLGDSPVVPASNLSKMLNENGPASVSAVRDAGAPTQVNITFSAPQEGYSYEIYLDGVFVKAGSIAGVDGWVFEAIQGVVVDDVAHTIRVLFVDQNKATSRFGPLAQFN